MDKVYRFIAWSLLIAAVVVGIARAVAIRWWKVPLNDPELAASIAPSLTGGDWVLLWRLTRPALGSLVMCPDPDDPGNVVIGRIAAKAGDTMTIHGDNVKGNDRSFEIEYSCTQQTFSLIDPDSLQEVEANCDIENLDDTLHMRGYSPDKDKRVPRTFEKKVSPGQIFLLSDNRAYTFDSRHFGTLERSSCNETIFFRLISDEGFFDVQNRLTLVR